MPRSRRSNSRSRSRSPKHKRSRSRSRSRSPSNRKRRTDDSEDKKFVWKLRDEKLKSEGRNPKEVSEEQRLRNMDELEKAKQRRFEREKSRKVLEEEKEKAQRAKEYAANLEGLKQEEQFFYEQAKKRAEIRIREKRPKLIDLFYALISAEGVAKKLGNGCIELDATPLQFLSNSPIEEIEQLRSDAQMFISFDKGNSSYWNSLDRISIYEIQTKRKASTASGIHKTVQNDIEELIKGKTSDELLELEQGIKETLNSGEAVDSEYYEAVLELLMIEKEKSEIDKVYQKSLYLFKKGEGNNVEKGGSQSPTFDQEEENGEEDNQLQSLREEMKAASAKVLELKMATNRFLTEEEMIKLESSMPMEEDESIYTEEYILPKKSYPWEDKVKPKKPKFYNRMYACHDWNPYNRVHYDADNPPPKTVTGYRFNIFYPDLVDTSVTPTYRIEPIPGDPDFLCLRFVSGAPYEDIAFKILNKEWEHSRKAGFKCTFERGALHLWFYYKKYKYRR